LVRISLFQHVISVRQEEKLVNLQEICHKHKNQIPILFLFLVPAVLFLSSSAAYPGRSVPGAGTEIKFGTWKITKFSGEVTISESGRYRNVSWNFPADPDHPGSNWVRVYSRGKFDYRLSFEGVEGSDHPDGLTYGGSGEGSGGQLFGHNEREDEGGRSESTIKGTYSDVELEATWTHTGSYDTGRQKIEIRGNAKIRAVRGAR
jgi:hypothetical protein